MEQLSNNKANLLTLEKYHDETVLAVDVGPSPDGTISAEILGSDIIIVKTTPNGEEQEWELSDAPEELLDGEVTVNNGIVTIRSEEPETEADTSEEED